MASFYEKLKFVVWVFLGMVCVRAMNRSPFSVDVEVCADSSSHDTRDTTTDRQTAKINNKRQEQKLLLSILLMLIILLPIIITIIRAVPGQHSSPELRLANKTKMHLKQK